MTAPPDGLRRSLPNALTIARLVVAAAFFATLSLTLRMGAEGDRMAADRALWGNIAIALFILAASTDFLDGYLARKWQVVSVFGRIMDPFVDKVLVLGAFIYLASPRFAAVDPLDPGSFTMQTGVATWMVVAILARELLVTSIRGVIEGMGKSFAAESIGKWKMVLQCIAIPVALCVAVNQPLLEAQWARIFRDALLWATVIVTLWSCLPYLTRATALLRHPRAEQDRGSA
jgi:CDP-diacylglycerol---glycerol-3-phosphate 3-phosphatidyltransferase